MQKQNVSENIIGRGTGRDDQTTTVLCEVKWERNAQRESPAAWSRLHHTHDLNKMVEWEEITAGWI